MGGFGAWGLAGTGVKSYDWDMLISLIVAVSENNVIGQDGHLPWHLSQDLKRFKAITSGHCILMGRKNYEDIGRPLPNRTNLVLSRNKNFEAPGCEVFPCLEEALRAARDSGERELFVIGGAHLYAAALPFAEKLYLTRVHADVPGDVGMPPLGNGWELESEEFAAKSEKDDFDCSFQIWSRDLGC